MNQRPIHLQATRARRLITCDGTETPIEFSLTMNEIKHRIGADTLDTVQLRHLGAPAVVMLVDDRGHERRRPVNAKATALYLANCYPGTTHTIRGDVVIAPDSDFGSDL